VSCSVGSSAASTALDRRHLFFVARLFQNRVNETWPIRPEDPGDAQHQSPRVRGQDSKLPFPFRFAVNADRIRRIVFRVRLVFFAIENIIGADVHEPGAFCRANFRQ